MSITELVELLPIASTASIWSLAAFAVFFCALQLAANRLLQVNWRKTVKEEIELYELLCELEKLSQDAPHNQVLDTLKNRLEERVIAGALRKKKLMDTLDSFPITCFGIPLTLVSFVAFPSEYKVSADNWQYLVLAFSVCVVILMIVDLVIFLISKKLLPFLSGRIGELFRKLRGYAARFFGREKTMIREEFDARVMELMKNGNTSYELIEAEKRKMLSEEGVEGFLELIGGKDYISTLSKALTHYCFRNGPVETMHQDGKLTDADMMILNKFMVDKLGCFFMLMGCEGYTTINNLLAWHKECGRGWDDPDFEKEMEDYEENMETLARASLMFQRS